MLNRTWNYLSSNLSSSLNTSSGPKWSVPDADLGKSAHLPPSLATFIQVICILSRSGSYAQFYHTQYPCLYPTLRPCTIAKLAMKKKILSAIIWNKLSRDSKIPTSNHPVWQMAWSEWWLAIFWAMTFPLLTSMPCSWPKKALYLIKKWVSCWQCIYFFHYHN